MLALLLQVQDIFLTGIHVLEVWGKRRTSNLKSNDKTLNKDEAKKLLALASAIDFSGKPTFQNYGIYTFFMRQV